MNINSIDYWNKRFGSQDWSQKGGNIQSISHAEYYIEHLGIPADFSGKICDFGCAEGDAMTVYRQYWPDAELIGVDFSSSAIDNAQRKYGAIARFKCSDYNSVPDAEIIISSHTFEHLENDQDVLVELLSKCKTLFVIVPYNEIPLGSEHLRRYDEESYKQPAPVEWKVCDAGWHYKGLNLFYHIHMKNIIKSVIGRPVADMPKQIIFRFEGAIETN